MTEQLPVGTKSEILQLLIKRELSAQGLADELAVSPAAARQHLETLEALGLVVRRKVITRPSRPTFLYRLSAKGARAFPKRYELLLGLVIEAMLDRHGPGAVAEAVRAAAERLASRVRERFARASAQERWELLVDWLEQELAWQADVTRDEAGRGCVTIHHCPFQAVSQSHGAVCGVFFATLIHALYADVPVEHVPAAQGPACCALLVAPAGSPAPAASGDAPA